MSKKFRKDCFCKICKTCHYSTEKCAEIVEESEIKKYSYFKKNINNNVKKFPSIPKSLQNVKQAISDKNFPKEYILENPETFLEDISEASYNIFRIGKNDEFLREIISKNFNINTSNEIEKNRIVNEIRKISMSDIQSTKAITGYTFQYIMKEIFEYFEFIFETSYGDNRSDFAIFNCSGDLVCIIPIKYNLRERWKDVLKERVDGICLYLCIFEVDDLSKAKIDEILNEGINIVVLSKNIEKIMELDKFDNMKGKIVSYNTFLKEILINLIKE